LKILNSVEGNNHKLAGCHNIPQIKLDAANYTRLVSFLNF